MGMQIDWYNQIVQITSPTTSVDAQVLHDFIEDEMASPEGICYGDIIDPQGKIENPADPGVYSQIILIFNSPWQVQFWGGSGYTRIFGGKLVGGLSNEVIKATGTAGDVTVLESPVDGLAIATGTGLSAEQDTKLDELHAFRGLKSGQSLVIKDGSEAADGKTLTVTRDSPAEGDVTVSRS